MDPFSRGERIASWRRTQKLPQHRPFESSAPLLIRNAYTSGRRPKAKHAFDLRPKVMSGPTAQEPVGPEGPIMQSLAWPHASALQRSWRCGGSRHLSVAKAPGSEPGEPRMYWKRCFGTALLKAFRSLLWPDLSAGPTGHDWPESPESRAEVRILPLWVHALALCGRDQRGTSNLS